MPLSNLNSEQLAAATAPMGYNLTIASAGTGKTSTIVGRIAYLLQNGVKPNEILLLTFTNKASSEMIERVERKFGNKANEIHSGTFHAVAYKFLKEKYHGISLKQPRELKILFKSIAEKRIYTESNTKPYSSEYLFDLYSLFLNSNNDESFEEWLTKRANHNEHIAIYEDLFLEYRDLKKEYKYVDYNDLLIDYANEMKKTDCPYKEILCDEYQDTNPLQNKVINSINPPSLFCVGDYDQSIYAFNGADISIISNFTKNYLNSKVWTLRKNYRSTKLILDLANRVIEKNERLYEKSLEVVNTETPIPPSLLVYEELREQYQGIAKKINQSNWNYEDIAIIFRNNASADGCEVYLRDLGIPSKRKDGSKGFFSTKEISLLLDLTSLIYNQKDMMAYINTLSYGPNIGNALAKEIYDGLERLGNGSSKSGLLNPNANIKPYIKSAKNENLGLFDDILLEADSARFNKEISASFKSHPILSHAKFNKDSAVFLDKFFNLIKEANHQTSPTKLLETIIKSRFYDSIIEIFAINRSKNKDGTIDNKRIDEAKERIDRKINLLKDISKNYNEIGKFLNAMILGSNESTQGSGVNLMSVHASKGLEFKVIFVIDLMDGRFPNRKLMAKGGSLEEERRLFYVAITRAKKILYLSYAKKDMVKNIYYEPSIFLYESGMLKENPK